VRREVGTKFLIDLKDLKIPAADAKLIQTRMLTFIKLELLKLSSKLEIEGGRFRTQRLRGNRYITTLIECYRDYI
jgi:hypothetical protein